MSDKHEFIVGDRVSFTIRRVTSKGISISSRDGRIAEISEDTAVVIYRKKRFRVLLGDLRKVGSPSALTEAFINAFKD